MKNQEFGLMLLGITLLIGLLAWSYETALENIVTASCSHGYTCPMYQALGAQKTVSTILIIILISVSVYLMLYERIMKKFILKKIKLAISSDERKIYEYLYKNNHEMLQSRLTKDLEFTKVKMTRILNRLERKGLIERKRKGLQNMVILRMKLIQI